MNEIPVFKFALVEGLSDHFLPVKGSEKASGWDVHSTCDVIMHADDYAKIPLGFRIFAPPGWWLELRPRSSSFAKKNLHALYGVIDEDYEGELVFACQYLPDGGPQQNPQEPLNYVPLKIKAGEAIGATHSISKARDGSGTSKQRRI